MKLSNIKDLGFLIEGVVPTTVLMTLREVVNAGKITNPAQVFLMTKLIMFLKNERPEMIRNIEEYHPLATDIEVIKCLSAEESVCLANWLTQILVCWTPETALTCYNPEQEMVEWINFVLHKQD